MLPNIELDSGATVAVDLEYTPAAAEIVTPMEGNLALAVKNQPPDGADWSPAVDQWTITCNYMAALEIDGNTVHIGPVPSYENNYAAMLFDLDTLPDRMFIHCELTGGSIKCGSAWVSGAENASPQIVMTDGVIDGVFDLDGIGAGPYSVVVGFYFTKNMEPSFTVPVLYVQQPVTLSAAMRPGQIAGTRGAREDNTIFTGMLPDGITLFPLDPVRYGHGNAGQRIGLLEFTGAGAADVRAAIVRWRDPS